MHRTACESAATNGVGAHVPVVLDAEDEAYADESRRGQDVVVALQGRLMEDAHLRCSTCVSAAAHHWH